MSDSHNFDFSSFQAILTSEGVEAHASEIHGVLTGLICAGFAFESTDYISMLADMFHQAESFETSIKNKLQDFYGHIWQKLLDDHFGFQLLLPDDDDSIEERSHALAKWVQGFNLGFGLQQTKSATFSDEVKEVLADFGEIANLSDEIDEDEVAEQAYFEIAEYVRISALLCFSELSSSPVQQKQKNAIH